MHLKSKISILNFAAAICVISALIAYFILTGGHGRESVYVEYKPVTMNPTARSETEQYIIEDIVYLDQGFIQSIAFVFDFYHVNYKLEGNKVLIEAHLARDLDYLSNLTSKARDENWLKNQREVTESFQ